MIFLYEMTVAAAEIQERNSELPTISYEKAVRLAIFTPAPQYPYKARANHLTGAGLVRVNINTRTGCVSSVRILKSTGHQILDNEALKAFRAWRFKSATVSALNIPVRFSRDVSEYVQAKGHSLWLRNATYWFLPEYPREAHTTGLTGKGVAVINIDPQTGYVTSAWMQKSTGHKSLDSAAIFAFRQWRFKPRTVTTLEIPIQFTSNGVFY
jgi:TonB family protein